ncbi:hydantoinase B/oxoprolinase family protein [Syntrophorhabdus aromaticivorans]|uniref:Hydantoinase B/oxoprolinase family protein n=1 Tax=Syntrophorhabdus aromaticivorans TaxID=328301 RepID=A0A971M5N5_9BACT|nr:hydantoinase B/oxoprolinase family protein [Syntrophorhabdus aromaticivorans]NLW35591.1 hydantoinase B/oxoprolinase family protein [Syntrophorhabdus aromaticivorans]
MNGQTYGRDYEVVQRLKPEPITAHEATAMENIDPTDFEIFNHKMNMIALEGKETTMKLGASAGMRWGDVAFGIYTAQGDLAFCATGIWFHAALGQIPVKYIVKHWVNESSVQVKEGDSFFFNDPFYCGVHGGDMGLAVPVFYKGKLICFTGAIVHSGENGSTEPGGTPTTAKSRYDEGFLVPPIKIGENYTLREDIMGMFTNMVRDPRTLVLDIKARLAACRISQRRILDLAEKKGPDLIIGGLRKILVETTKAARRKVSELPDGTFRQPIFMDTVGPESALIKLNIELQKKGETIKLNLKDTSPMIPDRPLNTFFQGVLGLTMVYFCGWFFYNLPANNALLDVLEWEFPPNTLVNAAGDTPTAQSPFVQVAYSHGIFHIGAKLTYGYDPLRAVASWYHGFGFGVFGGLNQWGEPIADITPEMNATACGARSDMDGADTAGSFFATMSDCSDVETTESDKPFIYLFRNFFQNHGAGKYRGGNGMGYGLVVHKVPWLFMGSLGYGSKFPASMGVFGGYAAATSSIRIIRQSNLKQLQAGGSRDIPTDLLHLYREERIQGLKTMDQITTPVGPFGEGDMMFISAGGGAGYGDVLEREPQRVVEDLKLGLATEWQAKNVYMVAYDPVTFRVDEEGTKQLRDEERARRLSLGVPYKEFEGDWLKKRPAESILKYYGPYPNPSANGSQR